MIEERDWLSKQKYLAGLQCPRRLWWEVHEPGADELEPDLVLRHIFDQGIRVGVRAREEFPGGVLIEDYDKTAQLQATRAAMDGDAAAVFEGTFEYDGVVIKADVLERLSRTGWVLVEVKSTTKVKPEHRPDLAVQLHVLRGVGVDVHRCELMHLNRECRYPDLSNLFTRADLTEEVKARLPEVSTKLTCFRRMCAGPLPQTETGVHCRRPHQCPFTDRCEKTHSQSFGACPDNATVASGLAEALDELEPPIAFLDFETVAPAIPMWDGCRPYDQIPVQISVHIQDADGDLSHLDWLTEGPMDPREEMAKRILRWTAEVRAILVYYQSFEEGRIRELQEAVPHFAEELGGVLERLVDLHPIVRDHVDHPAFGGSYSLKSVLPAFVPELSYDNLAITEGSAASVKLEHLMLRDELSRDERETARRDLLEYCRLDTLAMVYLFRRLRELSGFQEC